MANFYISDLHIGHENILRFDNRPFADVNEMNNKLIENWNARVRSDDTVYIPLTDEQVEKLLQATKGLPPYLFVMLGLYAGLRREEILALKWDSVYLDLDAPYLTVCRAWHTENNRPVILTELKTNAAKRSIPLPPRLLEALKEAKESSTWKSISLSSLEIGILMKSRRMI